METKQKKQKKVPDTFFLSMEIIADLQDSPCDTAVTPESIGIIDTPSPIATLWHTASGSITGGTVIAYTTTDPSKAWLTVEAIGDGFVMVCADSNFWNHGKIWCNPANDNCVFFTRWVFNADDEII